MCISIMEIVNAKDTGESHTSLSAKRCDSFLSISCNWQINNDKQFIDAVTTAPMQYAPARINCEDVASVDTCIALQPVDSNVEPCMLNIKISNRQRIARIAVVSEGNVLEIFKQFGEYETTILAEFIDEYEGNIVFLGETTIQPPTTEVGIKFIRTKNKGPPMWVYGIRLFLTDSIKEAKSSAFDYDVIQNLLSNISNDKINQRSEMAKRVFGLGDKQEIIRNYKEKFLETNSRYDDHISEMSDNEKVFPSCEDNGQSNASDCKNEVIKKNSATGYSNCGENYKKSDVDIKIHSETESIKEMKSGIFNYKDFIQTFLSNTGNGKMSQKPDMTRMFEFYDKFDNDEISEIMNNEQFYQEMLGTLTSDSDYLKCKTEIAKRSNGKDRRSYEASHEKLDSLGCKNKNIRKNSDEDCTNHEDNGKSDIDIRVYIDNKFHDMEKRLMERIDEMETNINQKLNAILERFESRLNLQP